MMPSFLKKDGYRGYKKDDVYIFFLNKKMERANKKTIHKEEM